MPWSVRGRVWCRPARGAQCSLRMPGRRLAPAEWGYGPAMNIIRHNDGSLTVPLPADRHAGDDGADDAIDRPTTHVLRPGEGGYAEALAEWDRAQNPDRGE